MKLNELGRHRTGRTYPNFPIFAWLESARGPEDLNGVRLAYIEPVKARYEHNLANAQTANDERWIRNVESRKDADLKQKYYTPDLGWWQSEEGFYAGQGGVGGETYAQVKSMHPSLRILKSREEAIAAAEQAGII